MKRFTRILSLVILLGIFLSLSGCSYLDELRDSRATIAEDGAIVMYDGTRFLLLPENEYFCPNFRYSTSINIVKDEEVPLLLTSLLGIWGYRSKDGQFLRTDTASSTYCREDLYDSIVERMNSDFIPELYCYTYYDYETSELTLYTFTPQQAEALESVLANQEPITLPAGAKMDYDYRVSLEYYSSDYLFSKDSVEICFAEGTFYVIDGELIYQVPNSMYVTFAQAVKKYLE